MKNIISFIIIFSFFLSIETMAFFPVGKLSADFKSSEELRELYPDITEYSERKENKNILCPFHRMIERSGYYDSAKNSTPAKILISIVKIISAAREFGCKKLGCGAAATAVSTGQNSHLSDLIKGQSQIGHVNITRLHKARGVAHECGLTFEKGGHTVSDIVRAKTLARLKDLSDSKPFVGTLSKEDLMLVKQEICDSQGVKMSLAGRIEVGLIYKYLGGHDRGFIEYDDVRRFLHAQMPLTKSIDGI